MRPLAPVHAVLPAITAAVLLSSAPLHAEDGEVDALITAMRLEETVAVMREEGLQSGADLGSTLAPQMQERWTQEVSEIYAADRITAALRAGLTKRLGEADLAPAIAFFTSEPGKSLISYELSAREAMLDEDVETVARETAALAIADRTDRVGLIADHIAANDLIEMNVSSALNSSYNWFRGLGDGDALPRGMTEEMILSEVRAQEPEIRVNTTEWLYSYLLLAYTPASDADLAAYILFSESPAGQQVNGALFSTFDEIFSQVAYTVGRSLAAHTGASDI